MRILLIGTRASRMVDAHDSRIEVWGDRPAWRLVKPHAEDPMAFWSSTTAALGARKDAWETLEEAQTSDQSAFVDCIEHERESDINAAEGAAILDVLLAAYQSAATGKPVEL